MKILKTAKYQEIIEPVRRSLEYTADKNKQAQYTSADEDLFVNQQMVLDRKSRDLDMRRRSPGGGKIKSRRKHLQEINSNSLGSEDEFERLLQVQKKKDLEEKHLGMPVLAKTKFRILAEIKK